MDLKAELLIELGKTEARMSSMDWTSEFSEMIEDCEYTPLKHQDGALLVGFVNTFKNGSAYQSASNRFHTLKAMNKPEAEPIGVWLRTIRNLLHQIRNTEMDALRKMWDSIEDECDKPFLKCQDCEFFGYSEKSKDDHECDCEDEDRTTKCHLCSHQAPTYDRLEKHIKAKHFKKCKFECKECDYKTDSKNEYERHNKSKAHKETCGVKKEAKVFECKTCDRQYAYESDYTKHTLSVKHKKLCG